MPENLKLAIDEFDAELFQHTDYPRATLVAIVLDYLDSTWVLLRSSVSEACVRWTRGERSLRQQVVLKVVLFRLFWCAKRYRPQPSTP